MEVLNWETSEIPLIYISTMINTYERAGVHKTLIRSQKKFIILLAEVHRWPCAKVPSAGVLQEY